MNIRLWELDNGDLMRLDKILVIGQIHKSKFFDDVDEKHTFDIWLNNEYLINCRYETQDEAKLARFKLVERWNACFDMIYSQEWCPEAGTYSNSSKPVKEDKYEGYRESEH